MKDEKARGGAVAGGGLQRPPAPCPARGPPAPSASAASSWRIAPWSTGRGALSSSAWSAVAGGQPPSAGKAGGLRRGSPTTVSRSRPSARNYFCGTRETGAAWWPSARLIVRRVRRDYKKEEKKKGLAERKGESRCARRPAPWPPGGGPLRGAQDGLRGLPRTLPGLAPSLAGAPAQHISRPISQPTVVVPCYAASNVEITHLGQGRRTAAVIPRRCSALQRLTRRDAARRWGLRPPVRHAMGFCGRLAPARHLQQQQETPHLERTL